MSELASSNQLRMSLLRWVLFLVPAVVLLGFLSGMFAGSGPGNPWFNSLVKPSLYPPPATFGIVWTALYVLMGVALAIVMDARGAWGRGTALIVFLVQLALNLAWSPLFFAAHQIKAALILLIVLDVAVLATVFLFARIRKAAAMLMLPYLIWIMFATALNWQFLVANPDANGREVSGAAARVEF